MTSMREKIARAIYETDDRVGAWAEWQDLADDDPTRLSSIQRADAVLDALMEPTKEMILGGNDAIDEHIDFWNYDSGSGYAVESAAAVACLQAMILAAKEGK